MNPPSLVSRVDLRLEMIPIPVSDVEIAKSFYADKLGFSVDHDFKPSDYGVEAPDGDRVVQLTPPGSTCSILLVCENPGFPMTPGTIKGVHLVVEELESAREQMLKKGVAVSEVSSVHGILYAQLSDPDGNTWLLQQIPDRR